MDIEKTMEFILQSQARSEARSEQIHERFERDHARAMQRMDRTDKQIDGIKKLITTGMKLIVRLEKRDDETVDRRIVSSVQKAVLLHEPFI